MSVSVRRLGESLGAEVTGIDLREPVGPADLDALNQALYAHTVICIRDQHLSPDEFMRAGALFGTLETQVNKHLTLGLAPEIGVVSSEAADVHGDGKRLPQGTAWHTDHSFVARPPNATILYAVALPDHGGNTSFCDMRAAYASLPAATKNRIDGLRARHVYESSRTPKPMFKRSAEEIAATPDVVHPLVRTYPPTGEKALYLSTTRLEQIEGMAHTESDALIDELMAHATQPRFEYHHVWRMGDMVVWDNRCSMHHANDDYPRGQKRLLHRLLIEGEEPY